MCSVQKTEMGVTIFNSKQSIKPHQPEYKKLKVLISAYACEPDKGSEPGVGWNWVKQIARFHEVWVITRANNRESIRRELRKNPIENLYFIYYDVPRWLSFWKNKERGIHLYYLLWQIGIYKAIRKIIKKEYFDLIHHISFGNIWLPTFLPFLKTPFVWGPVGGAEQVPKTFRKNYSFVSKLNEYLRDSIVATLHMNPFFLHACKKASLIMARTENTLIHIPQRYGDKTVKIIETGVKVGNNFDDKGIINKEIIQIISVGRLIHWKGFDIALNTFAEAFNGRNDITMVIIGDGGDKKRLQKICQKKNISEKIVFTGHLSHMQVLQSMSESSIFFLPSLKEGGAWVFYEAMLCRLPIICLDTGGPAEIVNEECGFKIKPTNQEQTVKELSSALLKLANNAALRKRMGEAARKRVEAVFDWDKKGEFIKEVYAKFV